MPHHARASKGSQGCCDKLLDNLRHLLPEVQRSHARETCSFFSPGRNQFAHVYHRGEESRIRVYFRGELHLPPSGQQAISIERRKKVEKGWDKEFPFFASISTDAEASELARVLEAIAFPLSEKKKRGSNHKEDTQTPSDPFLEGAARILSRKAYKRAVGARKACIAHFGCICAVCGFDFEKTYGEIGRGFIHVHHVLPISEFEKERAVDSKRDLRPVCPNCHAMLHHRSSPSLDQLRQLRGM